MNPTSCVPLPHHFFWNQTGICFTYWVTASPLFTGVCSGSTRGYLEGPISTKHPLFWALHGIPYSYLTSTLSSECTGSTTPAVIADLGGRRLLLGWSLNTLNPLLGPIYLFSSAVHLGLNHNGSLSGKFCLFWFSPSPTSMRPNINASLTLFSVLLFQRPFIHPTEPIEACS